ncbi:MAG TPA: ABC transporter permease [Oleiagrimonas sp.]|nr:ABC transporter permease [Oleiagrimonas sp.]
MKYFHLIWAALFRRKTRTLLTLVSILAAFLLFGLLNGVRVAFANAGQNVAGASLLMTSSRLSIMDTLPQALGNRIKRVDGVDEVAYVNWFGGAYQDAHNQVITYAISPNYMNLYPKETAGAAAAKKFSQTRTGLLVGEKLAKMYHWKVGQKIHLMSSIYPRNNGSKTWPFVIVGIMHPANGGKGNGRLQMSALMHWKYFDESNPYNRGEVGWYVSRVNNATQSARIAKAIDQISANSDHETRTRTLQAFVASRIKQMADIGLIVGSIMGAVFFTLLLLTGNTMAQVVRERTGELAVLKTLGFSNRSVLGIVLAESVLLVLIGGLIGLGLVAVVTPVVTAVSGGAITLPPVTAGTWGTGIGLMIVIGLLVGALPAIRAMRLNMVDALAGR